MHFDVQQPPHREPKHPASNICMTDKAMDKTSRCRRDQVQLESATRYHYVYIYYVAHSVTTRAKYVPPSLIYPRRNTIRYHIGDEGNFSTIDHKFMVISPQGHPICVQFSML